MHAPPGVLKETWSRGNPFFGFPYLYPDVWCRCDDIIAVLICLVNIKTNNLEDPYLWIPLLMSDQWHAFALQKHNVYTDSTRADGVRCIQDPHVDLRAWIRDMQCDRFMFRCSLIWLSSVSASHTYAPCMCMYIYIYMCVFVCVKELNTGYTCSI